MEVSENIQLTTPETYFSLTMLSNVDANDVKLFPKLDEDARKQIEAAFNSTNNSTGLNDWNLVWGPAIYKDTTAVQPVVGNLMYVAKKDDTFFVGIAGTNPISWFGWGTEDFSVNSVVPWDANNPQFGNISYGTSVGLSKLSGLTFEGTTLLQFLKENASSSDIVFGGHSLGGTLSPVVGLQAHEAKVTTGKIMVYAFAGASPGDGQFYAHFQKSISAGSFEYQAHNNKLDIVPHGWDQLDALPQLYGQSGSSFNICQYVDKDYVTTGNINGNAKNNLINGFVQWANKQAAGHDYKSLFPLSNNSENAWFDSVDINLDQLGSTEGSCEKMYRFINSAEFLLIRPHLNTIYQKMTLTTKEVSNAEVVQFFNFLFEAGLQHVMVYFDTFLSNTTQRDALKAVIGYNASKSNKRLLEGLAFNSLNNFMGKVAREL